MVNFADAARWIDARCASRKLTGTAQSLPSTAPSSKSVHAEHAVLCLLGGPLEFLDTANNGFAIQLDVLDDVFLVVQVQIAQQGCDGALGRYCHVQRVVALWVRWVELLYHVI